MCSWRARLFHFRTAEGAEADIVLERAEAAGPRLVRGVVFYLGETVLPFLQDRVGAHELAWRENRDSLTQLRGEVGEFTGHEAFCSAGTSHPKEGFAASSDTMVYLTK